MELGGLDIPESLLSGERCLGTVGESRICYATTAMLCPSSPQEYHTKKGCWGLVWGGKLAICELDLALRCVLFGPHGVIKEI